MNNTIRHMAKAKCRVGDRRRRCCSTSKVEIDAARIVLASLQKQFEQQQQQIIKLKEHVGKLHVLTKHVDDELEVIVQSICRIQYLLQEANFS